MAKPLDFSFAGDPVGYFIEAESPCVDGHYRYMPYRGPGHLKMGRAILAGQRPRCVMANWPGVSFTVIACPEYGVLQLAEFTAP